LAYVIACSSLLAILATLAQLLLMYQRDVRQIRSSMEYIESSYLPSISEAVYRIDNKLLESLLDGALNLPDIVFLEVIEHSGDSEFTTSRGDAKSARDISRQFPLHIRFTNGTKLSLGQLHAYASYEGVFERLWRQVILLLLTNGAKTLVAGIFIYFIFQSCLSRHLIRIASMVDEMDTENKDRNFLVNLERRRGKADELDQLVANINSMWLKLFDEIAFRRMSENQLKESEGRYRLILAASPDPIITYNMEGYVNYINPAFSKVFGWDAEETIGRRIDYIPEGAESEIEATHAALAKNKFFFRFNTKRYNKNRGLLDVDLSCGIWQYDTGEPGGCVVILRDMTEQKQMETQLQKAQRLEAIGTLAGGIAHDFNNILAVITGQAELMGLTDLTPGSRAETRAQEIIKAAGRAKSLIRQILDISRQNMVANVPVDLVPLVKETVKFARASAPAGIKVSYSIKESEAVVLSDASRMHQVLLNLCTNGIQAIEGENGRLEVGLEQVYLDETRIQDYPELTPGSYVKISVSDSGCGIPAEVLKQIFDPYFTTKRISGGTGLGLAVVHGIIKSHKGNISVYSEPGRGTTFNILLPHIDAAGSAPPEDKDKALDMGDEAILLVDDNQQLLETGSALLETLGYQVSCHSDPLMALEAFTKEPDKYSLVLTDYTMPKLNGRELYRELIRVRPDIKVVLCSGFGTNISEDSAEEEGFSAFLAKPFETRVLAKTIREVLDEKE
jgi:PAS domain S-box-containing protein